MLTLTETKLSRGYKDQILITLSSKSRQKEKHKITPRSGVISVLFLFMTRYFFLLTLKIIRLLNGIPMLIEKSQKSKNSHSSLVCLLQVLFLFLGYQRSLIQKFACCSIFIVPCVSPIIYEAIPGHIMLCCNLNLTHKDRII